MMDARNGIKPGRLTLAVALCLTSLTAAAYPGVQSGDVVVAEVGEQAITRDELEEFVADGLYPYLFPVRSEAYEHALRDLVTEELKRIDLFASGRASDSALVRRLARNVTEELGLAYAKRRYEDRYLNEETIRSEHEQMGRVVAYRQVVLAKPSDASLAALDSLRATTEEIQRRLEQGARLETLAQQYAGLIRIDPLEGSHRVTWEETVGSPRAFILFHLEPGEIRSFESPRTLSVVQVDGVERTSVPPLEAVREQIVSALHRWNAQQATEAFKAEWAALVDTTTLRWHSDGLEQITAWSNTPGFFESRYRAVVDEHVSAHGDSPVLTDAHGEVRLSDLPRIIDTILTPGSSGNHDRAFIQEYLLEAVRTERLADRARAEGLMEEIWQADTPSPVLAREFVQFYNEKHIEDRIPIATEDALRAFYRDVADSLFYQLARVHAEIIVRSDEQEIQELWERAKAGVPFERLSHRRLLRSFERTRAGDIVTRFNPEPPYLGAVAFDLEVGEISDPVAYDDSTQGRLHAILRVTKRLDERQLSFEEAGDRLLDAFEGFHRDRIAAQVEEDLRSRYPVQIHRDVLDALLEGSNDPVSHGSSHAGEMRDLAARTGPIHWIVL